MAGSNQTGIVWAVFTIFIGWAILKSDTLDHEHCGSGVQGYWYSHFSLTALVITARISYFVGCLLLPNDDKPNHYNTLITVATRRYFFFLHVYTFLEIAWIYMFLYDQQYTMGAGVAVLYAILSSLCLLVTIYAVKGDLWDNQRLMFALGGLLINVVVTIILAVYSIEYVECE